MVKLGWSLGSAVIGVAAVMAVARPAHGHLLVVVESTPGLEVDPVEVRRTIGGELGAPVLAPREAEAQEAPDLLVVAVDWAEIRMSLRAPPAATVSRAIPTPPTRPARLRAIAWLAVNLTRDQVGPIVAPAVAAEPAAPTATEPPQQQPPPVAPPSAIATQAAPAAPPKGPRWSVTATTGLSAAPSSLGHPGLPAQDGWSCCGTYEIDVQRQSSEDSLIFGGAIDVGPTSWYKLGLAGLVGTRWRRGGWFLEATGGVGVATITQRSNATTVTNSSDTGTMAVETVTIEDKTALIARGDGTVGVAIGKSLDLVGRLGVRLTSTGLDSAFFSATVGLRLRLP